MKNKLIDKACEMFSSPGFKPPQLYNLIDGKLSVNNGLQISMARVIEDEDSCSEAEVTFKKNPHLKYKVSSDDDEITIMYSLKDEDNEKDT